MKSKNKALIADVGDFHINSTTGLLNGPIQLDDGGWYHPSPKQRWIKGEFVRYCANIAQIKKRYEIPLWVIFKGELADVNKHRTTQLITRNESDVIDAAVECLGPLADLADHVIVIRGTEAHVGASGWIDEAVAKALRDQLLGDRLIGDRQTGTASHFIWRGIVGGVRLHVGHHPGAASRVPHTRGNEANRAAARLFYEYSKINARLWKAGRAPIGWPDLGLFGHNHWPADSLDSHPVRVVIGPSWQLNTSFGHKMGGDQMPIGGNVILCKDGGRFDLYPMHTYEPLEPFGEK